MGLRQGSGCVRVVDNGPTVTESVTVFEAQLDRLLTAVAPANEVNVLDSKAVRKSLTDTHRSIAEDERAHGNASAGAYWNLVMADWSSDEPAVFALAAWRKDTLTIYVGAARRAVIVSVCNNFTLSEVEQLCSAMESEFRMSDGGVVGSRSMPACSERAAAQSVSSVHRVALAKF